jgi:hypothetical protein
MKAFKITKYHLLYPAIIICCFLFVRPSVVRACDISVDPSDPGAAEALDNCLNAQRSADQISRDQQTTNSASAQANYQIKIKYFLSEDKIEKEIDAKNSSDSDYGLYKLGSVDCLKSSGIPTDPTTIDPNTFLNLIGNKEQCVNYLIQYLKKAAPVVFIQPKIVQPVKSNDQICSDKFGQNWKWLSGTTCGCKDGYVYRNEQCITYDASCSLSFPNTRSINNVNETGGSTCDCITGYVWNEQKTSCIVAPIIPLKSNDQVCQGSFGLNSIWGGTKSDEGKLICDCATGYGWNDARTECVAIIATQEKTPTENIPEVIIPSKVLKNSDKTGLIKDNQLVHGQKISTKEVAENVNLPVVNIVPSVENTNTAGIIRNDIKTETPTVKPVSTNTEIKPFYVKAWSWVLKIFGIKS